MDLLALPHRQIYGSGQNTAYRVEGGLTAIVDFQSFSMISNRVKHGADQ